MTIEKVIDRADRLRPNQYTDSEKIQWLSELDNQVYSEVLLMAEKNWEYRKVKEEITDDEGNLIEVKEYIDKTTQVPAITWEPYDETTPLETELLIDDIYADAYVNYLISKFDLYNREAAAYNNSALIFNTQYQNYINWYRANNMPITRRVRGI